MDREDDDRVKLGWLGLLDDNDLFYNPVLGVEDRFWNIKPETRLMVLEGWADAIQVLIEGNDEFGQEYGDSEEPKKQSSAVIIQFPDNV
jgi:hypothetical protein